MQKQHSQLWWSSWNWSDQSHLDCFKYRKSSVPGSVSSLFLEATAWNGGTSCPGYRLVLMQLTSSTWGFSVYKTAHRTWLRRLSIVFEEELKALWLCLMTELLHYLVYFDRFPLFLHFLTSLIKLIFWLKFFHRQKAGRGLGGQDHRVLLCFRKHIAVFLHLTLDSASAL